MITIGEQYKQGMLKKGFYYNEDKNIYYNDFGVYLWSVLIHLKKEEKYGLESFTKEQMEQIGFPVVEMEEEAYMFTEDYLQLLNKKEQGHDLIFLNEKKEGISLPFYTIYSKNYNDVLTKQKTLQK